MDKISNIETRNVVFKFHWEKFCAIIFIMIHLIIDLERNAETFER